MTYCLKHNIIISKLFLVNDGWQRDAAPDHQTIPMEDPAGQGWRYTKNIKIQFKGTVTKNFDKTKNVDVIFGIDNLELL